MALDDSPNPADPATTSDFLRSYGVSDELADKQSFDAYREFCLQMDKTVKDRGFVTLARYPAMPKEHQHASFPADSLSFGKMLSDLYLGRLVLPPATEDVESPAVQTTVMPTLIRTPRRPERPAGSDDASVALLGQWVTGQDPSAYRWPGPSTDIVSEDDEAPRPEPTPKTVRKKPLRPTASLGLPTFLPSSSSSQVRLNASSQIRPPDLDTFSQGPSSLPQPIFQSLPATQITRGPFGDRTAPSVRRFPVKKRAVGF